jgi:hypothetical protein
MFPNDGISWDLKVEVTLPENPGCSSHGCVKEVFIWYLNIHFIEPVPPGFDLTNSALDCPAFESKWTVAIKSIFASAAL